MSSSEGTDRVLVGSHSERARVCLFEQLQSSISCSVGQLVLSPIDARLSKCGESRQSRQLMEDEQAQKATRSIVVGHRPDDFFQ